MGRWTAKSVEVASLLTWLTLREHGFYNFRRVTCAVTPNFKSVLLHDYSHCYWIGFQGTAHLSYKRINPVTSPTKFKLWRRNDEGLNRHMSKKATFPRYRVVKVQTKKTFLIKMFSLYLFWPIIHVNKIKTSGKNVGK